MPKLYFYGELIKVWCRVHRSYACRVQRNAPSGWPDVLFTIIMIVHSLIPASPLFSRKGVALMYSKATVYLGLYSSFSIKPET